MAKPRPAPGWEDRDRIAKHRRPMEERYAAVSTEDIERSLGCLVFVGFDPGETTGWSVMTISAADLLDRNEPVHTKIADWRHGQINSGTQIDVRTEGNTTADAEALGAAVMAQIVDEQFTRSLAVAVVFEDFILRTQNKKREALSPVRVTARVEQLLWESNDVTVRKQQPSAAKTTVTDERLRRWGLFYDGHRERHARDADRHNIYFMRDLRANPHKLRAAFPIIGEARRRGLL